MSSNIGIKVIVIVAAIIGLLLIWSVGEGDASQAGLQQVVYGQSIMAQSTSNSSNDVATF